MMRKNVVGRILPAVMLALLCGSASAQGVLGDVLSGNLLKPRVGQWAWYDLKDVATEQRYVMRQAIVAEEKVGKARGYWLETEIIPQVGYPMVYKMLVTGPASDPSNVHRILFKQGNAEPMELPKPEPTSEDKPVEPTREEMGTEKVTTQQGEVEGLRVALREGGQVTEMWINEEVRPMGIVRLESPEGSLLLRGYGQGGGDGESAFDKPSRVGGAPGNENRGRIQVNVDVDAGTIHNKPKEETPHETPVE